MEVKAHPELDTSPLLGEEDTRKYQSFIGALNWAITLGRIDVFMGHPSVELLPHGT